MMECTARITPDLLWVGGNDRRLNLFENIFPIPRGVSYNSYLLLDEKTVLVDTVDKAISGVFFDNLTAALDGRQLNYIVVNHMEPDHAATLAEVCERYPGAQVMLTAKGAQMAAQFFGDGLRDRLHAVGDGAELVTGRHHLRFFTAPMVHWPEVMVTWDETDRVLFSADAFGAFGAVSGFLFADEVDFARDWLDDARRYYTNIVGKYGAPVQALLKKAAALDIAFLCPLHGPVWRRDIAWFVEKYQRWSTYRPEEDGVLVAYASIYGHTENAAEVFAMALRDAGVKHVAMYDVSVLHPQRRVPLRKAGAAFGHLQPRRIPGHGNAASGPQGARPAGSHRGAGGERLLGSGGRQTDARDPGLHEKHTRAGAGAHHPLGAGGGHARGAHRPGPSAGGGISGMCGRYFLDDTKEANERLLNLLRGLLESGDPLASQVHTGEIFPTQLAPVIVADGGGVGVRAMRWGFPRAGGRGVVINSRSEKADFTPMFQRAVRERRCLVPVSGFYEWRRTPSGGKTKEKFAFQSQGGVDKGLMYLAGVYGEFLGGFRAGGFDGFAILTREADEQMRPYHDRMPVILDDESVKKLWLLSPPQIPYADLRRHFDPPRLYVRPAPAER